MRYLLALVFGLVTLSAATGALAIPHALKGVALVIGETNYLRLPVLTNPDKDARDVDHMLDDLGFDVERTLDGTSEQMRASIARFLSDAKGADVALVYYAGHGIEAGGKDYIMGTDANIGDAASASATLISLDDLLAQLQKAVPINIVLLDACRTNPFTGQQVLDLTDTSSPVPIGQAGLQPVRGAVAIAPSAGPTSLGTLVGFSASPGQSALDGPAGANSPYAAAVLEHLSAGGYSFGDIMTMVSQEVYVDTGARQLPWTNSSLSRVLYFRASGDTPTGGDATILADRRKLLLNIASEPEQSKAFVEAVATQENLKLADLYSMLEIINNGKASPDVPTSQQKLLEVAQRVRTVLDDPLLSAAPTDPQLAQLDALANKAIDAGAFTLAYQYRQQEATRAAQIEKGLDAQQGQVDKQQSQINDTRRELAGVYARVAEAAMYTSQPTVEAAAYTHAAAQAASFDPKLSLKLKQRAADADLIKGNHGDGQAYLDATPLYQDMLTHIDKAKYPELWGETEAKLAWVLGSAQDMPDKQSVRDATIAAAQAALTVVTPQTNFQAWSQAYDSLTHALALSHYFDAALKAGAALVAGTPRSRPLDWADAEWQYGNIYEQMGNQSDPPVVPDLQKAADIFGAAADAAKPLSRFQYEEKRSEQAFVLVRLGKTTGDRATMLQGLAYGKEALEDFTGQGTDLGYHAQLYAQELEIAGEALLDDQMLQQAIAQFRRSENLRGRVLAAGSWGSARKDEGDIMLFQGRRKHDKASLGQAVDDYNDALAAFNDIGDTSSVSYVKADIDQARSALASF